jgi:hypothetical protein
MTAAMSKVAPRKAANRRSTAGSTAGGIARRRNMYLKAKAERPIDKSPGPNPPKRLLTATARRKHDTGASIGHATARATPLEIAAKP